MKIQNEIIFNKDKTWTVIGSVAHEVYFKGKKYLTMLHELMLENKTTNRAYVIERDLTLRAGQSTKDNAAEYMNENRVLIVGDI